MGTVVGLGAGIGLLLIWSAFALPRGTGAGRADPRPGRLRQMLTAAGMAGTAPSTLVATCVAAFVLSGLVALVLTGVVVVATAFAAMGGYLPLAIVGGRVRRRSRELAEVWPDAVDNLASAVRAGLSLPDALAGLATRGPESLRPAFAAFAVDHQVTGRFGDCLDRLKLRLADPVGDRVVEGLRIAREVGGGELGRLLRNLSGYLRDDLRTRSELEARQSWAVNGARLAVAAPWLVLLGLSGQPDVIGRYDSVGGAIVLGIGAALCVVAYRVMMRIGRLPTKRRILS